MALPSSYKVGTVTVSANSAVVTGDGTNWTGAGLREGDIFAARGLSVSIASVDGATQITLSEPWRGTALTAQPYEIRYVGDTSRILSATRNAITRFEAQESEIIALQSPPYIPFQTVSAAKAAIIPGGIDSFAVIGKGTYLRSATNPPVANKIQTADGAWWKLLVEKPIFILATGQSNMQQHRSYGFTPAPNVLRWNNAQGNMSSVGNAFEPLSGTTMNPSISFANQVAKDNPNAAVYLLNVAKGAQTIDSWLPGAATEDDVYQNILDNIGPALTAAGVTEISALLWWQGESGGFQPDYPAKFETVQSRFRGNGWFPPRTPTVIFGTTTTARTGEGRYDQTNFVLQDIAASAGEYRQYVNTPSFTAETYWNDLVHMSGLGYERVGIMAAEAYAGKSRFVPYRLKGKAPYLYDADFVNLGTGVYATDTSTLNTFGTFSGLLKNESFGTDFQVQEADQITTGKRMRRYRRAGTFGSWYGINGAVVATTQGAAAQTVNGTTRTVVNFPTVTHDPLGMWNGSSFTPHAGLWLFSVSVRISGGATVGERITLQVRNQAETSIYLSHEVDVFQGATAKVTLSGLVPHGGSGTYVVTLQGTASGNKTIQLDRQNTYFNAHCIDGA